MHWFVSQLGILVSLEAAGIASHQYSPKGINKKNKKQKKEGCHLIT
jgi:hypothetical protein